MILASKCVIIKQDGVINMLEKTTDDLLNEIEQTNDLEQFFSINDDAMICSTIAEELNTMLIEKGIKKADVIRKSGLDTVYGNQIFSGVRKPKRDKIIALAFGLGLDFQETQQLLKRTFFNLLYVKNKRDSVIIYCIKNGFDIIETNIELDKNELEPLE